MSSFALKLAAWIVALALVALPVVGLVNGWFASERWPFRRLEVEAEFQRINAEQLRAAIGPHLEAGFFAVELDRVRRVVESLPWVESAYVRKRWPDVLEVRIVERRPAAVWGDSRLVSTAGELFAVPGDLAPQGLPRLAGPEDRALEVLEFHGTAREVLARSGLALAGTELSGRGSWSIALENGARVVIGREAPRDRLQRFVDTLPRVAANDAAVWVRADLRYANGYAIEWHVPEPPPAAPALDPGPRTDPPPPPTEPQTAEPTPQT